MIADQVAVLEEDLAQLYDDQFIETCAEWVIPYIGDLIGFRGIKIPEGLKMPEDIAISPRAQVANTISSRKKKGTFSNIAKVVRDSTGWDCSVIEYFKLLAMTQNLNHLYLNNISIADIRHWQSLVDLNRPFCRPEVSDHLPHNIDVRSISSGKGLYNIPNIGIFIWRLQSQHLGNSPAFKLDDHRYKFDPMGNDIQLFSLLDGSRISMPLSRTMLYSGLNGHSFGISLNVDGSEVFPNGKINGDGVEAMACDLSDMYDNEGKLKWAHTPVPYGTITIDPVLGRIAFPESLSPKSVQTSFCYGFSADMGGGEYSRSESFTDMSEDDGEIIVISSNKKDDIMAALIELADSGNETNVIEINNNERYDLALLTIDVSGKNNSGKTIEIRAGEKFRPLLVLKEDMVIKGNNGVVFLNGLIISGGSIRANTGLSGLKITHCTLVPGLNAGQDKNMEPSLVVTPDRSNSEILVEIDKSIVGPIRMPAEGAELVIQDSIVDSPSRGSGARTFPALILNPLDFANNSNINPHMSSKIPRRSFVRITIGRQGPYEVTLQQDLQNHPPKNLEEARALIESAIHNAYDSPGFHEARVIAIDSEGLLAIIPGVPEDIQIELIGLDLRNVIAKPDSERTHRTHALMGRILPRTLNLSSPSPSMTVSLEGKGKQTVSFTSSASPKDIAASIQGSLSAIGLSDLIIACLDEKFMVISSKEDAVPLFGPTDGDGKTFEELGLRMDEPAISSLDGGSGPESTIERSTVLGLVKIKRLDKVSESIFADPLIVDQRQEGCLRFSFVPRGSKTPQRYECPQGEDNWTEGLRFTSTCYRDPGYCQLSLMCSPKIKQGDGMGELGAFHNLYQPQRETNMRICLNEHMRFGLDFNVFYST